MNGSPSFGAWLRQRRKALDLTQAELARCAGCVVGMMKSIEGGTRRPSHQLAERLAACLNLGPDERAAFLKAARGLLAADQVPASNDSGPARYLAFAPAPLPAPLTTLIGREAELAELHTLLTDPGCRLVTIVGPGGIGKTRLALAAAASNRETFASGAVFVSLAAVENAAVVAPTILFALNVPLQGQRDPFDQLREVLRSSELLLILDNLEQVLAADAEHEPHITELVVDLLRHAPGVKILATSRERLGLPGEWLVDLVGLHYPSEHPGENLEHLSAVQLFVQRARQVQRPFVLTDSEAAAVARLCRLVEGMPLAIELAAAEVRGRSVTAIADALETSFVALTTTLRAVPERHRSMGAAFEYSWRLLSGVERQVFARLSVFRGGFTEQAAKAVGHATPELLAVLVDKSLVRWDGEARYDMHELLRQYAHDKLEQGDAASETRKRHAAYFLERAETVAPLLYGTEQLLALDELSVEHHNFQAALEWSRAASDVELLSRLTTALVRFWYVRGFSSEGRRWLAEVLAQPGLAPSVRAQAYLYAADFVSHHAVARDVRAMLEASIALFRTVDDKRGLINAVTQVGWLAIDQGDSELANASLEESVRLARSVADPWLLAWTLFTHAYLHDKLGDDAAARSGAEESIAHYQAAHDRWNGAGSLSVLGNVALRSGNFTAAYERYEEALALWCATGDQVGRAWGQRNLGILARCEGNTRQAIALLGASLRIEHELGRVLNCAACLIDFAGAAVEQGWYERAIRLFGVADAVFRVHDAQMFPIARKAYDQSIVIARRYLDSATFTSAWATGQTMTLDEAITEALAMVSDMLTEERSAGSM